MMQILIIVLPCIFYTIVGNSDQLLKVIEIIYVYDSRLDINLYSINTSKLG